MRLSDGTERTKMAVEGQGVLVAVFVQAVLRLLQWVVQLLVLPISFKYLPMAFGSSKVS